VVGAFDEVFGREIAKLYEYRRGSHGSKKTQQTLRASAEEAAAEVVA
jgi:hypothetical protein